MGGGARVYCTNEDGGGRALRALAKVVRGNGKKTAEAAVMAVVVVVVSPNSDHGWVTWAIFRTHLAVCSPLVVVTYK